MVLLLKEISSSRLRCQVEDTLILLEEIWLLRPEMEETLKCGTLITDQEPLSQEVTTNLLILEVVVDKTTSKYGTPTAAGGKSSSLMVSTLSVIITRRPLM
jgi:hypothetical protein